MKVLITGIQGFVGSHFTDYLRQNHPDVEVHGTVFPGKPQLKISDNSYVPWQCDMTDYRAVEKIMKNLKPDQIFHLAGQSEVRQSWDQPWRTLETNIRSQLNIFESIRKLNVKHYQPTVLIAGSSEEYGKLDFNEIPVKEDNPLRPLSPYAVSKVAQDLLGYQYFQNYGIRVLRMRAFNHSGPRRPETFVDSGFAKQIVEIEIGKRRPEILVGNLSAIRDFCDVRDVVKAYWMAMSRAVIGEVYNICSGHGYAIKETLNQLLKMSPIKNIVIKTDPLRMRPSDLPIIVGDNNKFVSITGWHPEIPYLDNTLKDILEYWRDMLKTS